MVDCAGTEQESGVDVLPVTTADRLQCPAYLVALLGQYNAEMKILFARLTEPLGKMPDQLGREQIKALIKLLQHRQRQWDRFDTLGKRCVPFVVKHLTQHHGVEIDPELLTQLRERRARV